MDLITLQELKEFLNVTTTKHDVWLTTQAIPGVSRRIQTLLGRELDRLIIVAETQQTPGDECTLELRRWPVDTGEAIEVRCDGEVVDPDDYTVVPLEGLIIHKKQPWPCGVGRVEVDYTGGYPVVSGVVQIPDDLKVDAVLVQCAYLFQRRDAVGATSNNLGAQGMTFQGPYRLLTDVRKTALAYKRLRF